MNQFSLSLHPAAIANVEVTVARHPPQVIVGHTNLAMAPALRSCDVIAEAPGTETGCSVHPTAATSIRHISGLRIVFTCLNKTYTMKTPHW